MLQAVLHAVDIGAGSSAGQKRCRHKFCIDCMQQYVTTQVQVKVLAGFDDCSEVLSIALEKNALILYDLETAARNGKQQAELSDRLVCMRQPTLPATLDWQAVCGTRDGVTISMTLAFTSSFVAFTSSFVAESTA
jgi:hypothetical protein